MRLKTPQKMSAVLTFFCAINIFVVKQVFAADISQIQKQIKQQEQKIAQQKLEQSKLQSNLKAQENKISNVVGLLRQTETDLKETRRLIAETNKQIKNLENQEAKQKANLAQQFDSAYRAGNPSSVIEHLLSDEAQKADRMNHYYQHMNQARIDLIEQLRQTRKQLAEQKEIMSGQQKTQQGQLSEQKKQQQELQKMKNERQTTLNQLNKTLERDQNKLETLKANENALRQEIQRAAQAAKEQEQRERDALAQKKQSEEQKSNKPYQLNEQEQQLVRSSGGLNGKYAFPVTGKILHRFGSTQVGEVKWKGIVIAASAGSPVRAIADGRVILANWLQGYGLVVVIEHGRGDMSLYGYNQSVSVKVGSLVRAGQKIAEVGSSGGQGQSGLYFEIRRQGNAVNPLNWLR